MPGIRTTDTGAAAAEQSERCFWRTIDRPPTGQEARRLHNSRSGVLARNHLKCHAALIRLGILIQAILHLVRPIGTHEAIPRQERHIRMDIRHRLTTRFRHLPTTVQHLAAGMAGRLERARVATGTGIAAGEALTGLHRHPRLQAMATLRRMATTSIHHNMAIRLQACTIRPQAIQCRWAMAHLQGTARRLDTCLMAMHAP